MSFPRYERYKESGIEWLGEVPEHWEVKRLRFTARVNPSKSELGPLPADTKVSFFPMDAIQASGSPVMGAERTYDDVETGYTYFRDGDVAFAKITPCFENGKRALFAGLINGIGFGTTELIVLRSHEQQSVPTFLYWLCASSYFMSPAEGTMYGTGGQKRVSDEFVKDFSVALPPVEEQLQIAKFLDRETAKIDVLIEEQRRLIALLKEKRQAVISHAVTKGLTPSAPMKDSGAEWIGRIPSHWLAVPLKHRCLLVKDGTHLPPPRVSEGIPLLSVRNMFDGGFGRLDDDSFISYGAYLELCKSFVPLPGDVLLAIVGGTMGKSAIIPDGLGEFHLQRSVGVFRTDSDKLSNRFLKLIFESLGFQTVLWSNVGFSAQPGIYLGTLVNIPITCPPLKEQLSILEALDKQLRNVESLTRNAESVITLLQERRSALISAAVAGKINVTAQVAKPVVAARPYSTDFARPLLAATILARTCQFKTTGRVKLQKLIHLCEYHAQIPEIHGNYQRQAAGPFDPQAMDEIRNGLLQQRWFEEYKDGDGYRYRALEKAGGHKQYLPHWADKQAKIDQILSLLGDATTERCGIVSTLYAAWNDLLLEGKAPTDAEIIYDASSAKRWHESKEQIAADKWTAALKWMKEKGLIPVGYGTHTTHQSDLFTVEVHEPA